MADNRPVYLRLRDEIAAGIIEAAGGAEAGEDFQLAQGERQNRHYRFRGFS